jgi:hypothetical protein
MILCEASLVKTIQKLKKALLSQRAKIKVIIMIYNPLKDLLMKSNNKIFKKNRLSISEILTINKIKVIKVNKST